MRFLAITGALSMVPASVAGPLHVQRDLSPSQHLSEKWTYSGCYVDNISNRTLKGGYQSVDNQSGRHCTDYCDSLGYDIAGTGTHSCFYLELEFGLTGDRIQSRMFLWPETQLRDRGQ